MEKFNRRNNKTMFIMIIVTSYCQLLVETKQSITLSNYSSDVIEVSNSLVPVLNKNFDVRENNFSVHSPLSCLKYKPDPTKSSDCHTGLPLQLSSYISDKIFDKDNEKTISPMNSITCFKKDYDCSTLYSSLDDFETDMNSLIKFYNEKGGEYIEDFPYSFDINTGKFTYCSEFQNKIEFFDKNKLTIRKLSSDFEVLKREIFDNGAILAAIYPDNTFVGNSSDGIYTPDEEKAKLTYYLLRIIGWRTLENKVYWVFAFHKDNQWRINNFAMIEVTAIEMTYYTLDKETKETIKNNNDSLNNYQIKDI